MAGMHNPMKEISKILSLESNTHISVYSSKEVTIDQWRARMRNLSNRMFDIWPEGTLPCVPTASKLEYYFQPCVCSCSEGVSLWFNEVQYKKIRDYMIDRAKQGLPVLT